MNLMLDLEVCPTYYEAGFARGVTAGSFLTIFCCMLYWQCTRTRFSRQYKWHMVAEMIQ